MQVPLLHAGRDGGNAGQPGAVVSQVAHSSAPRAAAHDARALIWSVAIASGHAVAHWEPTVLIVQSASTAQARADDQRSCTSVSHCALPSRHCCDGALHVAQQAPVAMNSSPAGQLCGQVSR